MEWGKNDCFIELFGPDAHNRIAWLRESHEATVQYLMLLPSEDRRHLMRSTFAGQNVPEVSGSVREDFLVGDIAIGHFDLALGREFQLPDPWIATMGPEYIWWVRVMSGNRSVRALSIDKVYRRCRS